jgi:rhodanese-related sulfurtransferase
MKLKFLILMTFFTQANAQVESKSFDALLKLMLKKDVQIVSCDELKKMNNVILLDTRAKKEFDVSHLKNAIWVGYEEFNLDKMKAISKDAKVIVYCSIGVRSEKIGEKLQAAGYQNVHNLYGSIFEWVNEGNPVVDSLEKPTMRVHAYNKKWGIWLDKGEKVY